MIKDYIGTSVPANFLLNVNDEAVAVGGKIHFYGDHLVFKSHTFNVVCGTATIKYSEIDKIIKSNTLGIVPNGLTIFMKDGKENRLVVNKRNDIIKFLNMKKKYTEKYNL